MRVKRMAGLLLILFMLAILSGCWSRKEIEELAISTAMGIDRVQVKGQMKWRVALQIVRTGDVGQQGQMQGGGGQGQRPFWLITSLGDTIEDAVANARTRSPRHMFLAHNEVLILGESLAREGIQDVTDFMLRERSVRLQPWVLVAKGDALEILRAEGEIEELPSMEMMGILETTGPMVSKVYKVQVKDFINQLISPGRDAAASKIEIFPPVEENAGSQSSRQGSEKLVKAAIRISGTAVFQKDRLVGWLGDRDSKGYLYVINQAEGGVIPINMHGGVQKDVSFMMTRSDCRITPIIEEGKIHFNVHIKAEGDIEEHMKTMPEMKPEHIEHLEKQAAQEIKSMVEDSIRLNQEEYEADIFGFGNVLHKKYPQFWQSIEKEWRDIYPTVTVTVEAEAQIRRTGMIAGTPPIQ